ncbi:hypothetical protein V8D89_007498 [Ganoderma adspersum]
MTDRSCYSGRVEEAEDGHGRGEPVDLVESIPIPMFNATEINTLALYVTQSYARLVAGGEMVKLLLSSLSFGVLTTLSFTSIYFLLRRGSLTQTNVRIPLLSTTLLYISTGTYIAALAWNQSSAVSLVGRAVDGLYSPSYDGPEEISAFQEVVRRQSWMETTATATNFLIGDAVVWWRASAIWHHRAVYCIGPLFLMLSFVFCIVGVYVSSRATHETTELVEFISENAYAYTAVFMSLATNVLATALIAYKAWEHRRLVKKHFAASGTKSQVLQALALLVESGSMYCVLMTFAAVYEVASVPPQAGTGLTSLRFYDAGEYITHGCIIPLAAIYPTVIIVLVALRRSPIDTTGLSRVTQDHDLALTEDDTSGTFPFHRWQVSSRRSAGFNTKKAANEGTCSRDHRST